MPKRIFRSFINIFSYINNCLIICSITIENFIIKCREDISKDFVVNLTRYNDAELLGMRKMMMNHDLEQIKEFAKSKGEEING